MKFPLSSKTFTHPLVWLAIIFAFGLLALFLRLATAPADLQGSFITYTDAGTEYVAVDSNTLPIKLHAPFDQNSVRLIAPDPNTPKIQFASINQKALQNITAQATQETSQGSQLPPASDCDAAENILFLDGKVVLKNVRWRVPNGSDPNGPDKPNCGVAIPHLKNTGHFYFFDSQNIELTVKALDASTLNNYFWVFFGALSNVEWGALAVNNANPTITKEYYNPPNTTAAITDTTALPSGSNSSPTFNSPYCGNTVRVLHRSSGDLQLGVADMQSDSLTARITILKGDNDLKYDDKWKNFIPVTGSEVFSWINFPDKVADYTIGIEVSDGKSLLPTLCTMGIRVI